MTQPTWLLLTYKVPAEPAAPRMAVWRKLKALGAVYLQNGVCVVPKSNDHRRRLKLIENDIAEAGGEAVLLESFALDRTQRQRVVERFKADRDEAYREFLTKCADFEAEIAKETKAKKFGYAELEENDIDLKKLKTWFERIQKLDFYNAEGAAEAEHRLNACDALLETFAKRVFDAQDENR